MIEKREAAEKKKREEKVNKAKIHQITSVSELIETLGMIDRKPINENKKTAGKLKLIKEQIKLRKALFKEKIAIAYSSKGKQRPVHKILNNLLHISVKNVLKSIRMISALQRMIHLT